MVNYKSITGHIYISDISMLNLRYILFQFFAKEAHIVVISESYNEENFIVIAVWFEIFFPVISVLFIFHFQFKETNCHFVE